MFFFFFFFFFFFVRAKLGSINRPRQFPPSTQKCQRKQPTNQQTITTTATTTHTLAIGSRSAVANLPPPPLTPEQDIAAAWAAVEARDAPTVHEVLERLLLRFGRPCGISSLNGGVWPFAITGGF